MLYVNAKTLNMEHKLDVEDIVGDLDGHKLREELESCKHFSTNAEMVIGRHRVFNFAM